MPEPRSIEEAQRQRAFLQGELDDFGEFFNEQHVAWLNRRIDELDELIAGMSDDSGAGTGAEALTVEERGQLFERFRGLKQRINSSVAERLLEESGEEKAWLYAGKYYETEEDAWAAWHADLELHAEIGARLKPYPDDTTPEELAERQAANDQDQATVEREGDVWTVTQPIRPDYTWSDGASGFGGDLVFTADDDSDDGPGPGIAEYETIESMAAHAGDELVEEVRDETLAPTETSKPRRAAEQQAEADRRPRKKTAAVITLLFGVVAGLVAVTAVLLSSGEDSTEDAANNGAVNVPAPAVQTQEPSTFPTVAPSDEISSADAADSDASGSLSASEGEPPADDAGPLPVAPIVVVTTGTSVCEDPSGPFIAETLPQRLTMSYDGSLWTADFPTSDFSDTGSLWSEQDTAEGASYTQLVEVEVGPDGQPPELGVRHVYFDGTTSTGVRVDIFSMPERLELNITGTSVDGGPFEWRAPGYDQLVAFDPTLLEDGLGITFQGTRLPDGWVVNAVQVAVRIFADDGINECRGRVERDEVPEEDHFVFTTIGTNQPPSDAVELTATFN